MGAEEGETTTTSITVSNASPLPFFPLGLRMT